MRKISVFILLSFLFSSSKKVSYDSGFLNWKSIRNVGQMHINWCYAAVSQMVLSYYDISLSQIEIANELNGSTECGVLAHCSGDENHADSLVNHPCYDAYGNKAELVNFLSSKISEKRIKYKETVFNMEEVKKVLKEGVGPVVVNLGLGGGMEHAVLIVGYIDFGRKQPVAFNVMNPGGDNCTGCQYIMLYDKKESRPIQHITEEGRSRSFTLNKKSIVFIPERIIK